MSKPWSSGPWRDDRIGRPPRAEPGATTGSGRPGSSSARRWVPRRRSSAGGRSGPPARAAWWTGPASSGPRSGGCGAPRAASRSRSSGRRSRTTGEAMERIVPALSAALETELPGVVERSEVVDRAGWVRANTTSFAALIGRLEGELLDQVMPPGGGLAKATMALANRWVTTRQLGILLGFMGQRVLGQYDLAMLSAEIAPGRLLFVEENVRMTARALDVPLVPFRTWIALHETTHAFEFEAHPWLRPYLAESPRATAGAVRARCARSRPGRDARARPRAARRGRRRALDGAAHGRGAAPPVPRDAGRDEPARGLQRLRDGRRREGARAGRRADLRPLPRAAHAADPVRAGDAPDHRHGPQDGAVPQGRAVRPGHRRAGRARCPATPVGGTRDAAAARRRSTRRSAGWRACWRPGRPRDDVPRSRGPRDPDPDPTARRARSPSARSCRPAIGRATSSASGRQLREPGS